MPINLNRDNFRIAFESLLRQKNFYFYLILFLYFNLIVVLYFSEIRMPLIWKDTDHFKNKGDYRRFAVFCLLKVGTEIYDTQMITSVDRSLTDISFEDVCVFGNVPPDFEFKLDVYSRVLHDDLSIASTPRKLTKKISTSVSRTLGRRIAMSMKDDLEGDGFVND